MSDDAQTIYDTTGVTPRPISAAEWEYLCEMFGSDGWAVFENLMRLNAANTAKMALNSFVADEERLRQTIYYEAALSLVMFRERLHDAVSEAAGSDEPAPTAEAMKDDESAFLLQHMDDLN